MAIKISIKFSFKILIIISPYELKQNSIEMNLLCAVLIILNVYFISVFIIHDSIRILKWIKILRIWKKTRPLFNKHWLNPNLHVADTVVCLINANCPFSSHSLDFVLLSIFFLTGHGLQGVNGHPQPQRMNICRVLVSPSVTNWGLGMRWSCTQGGWGDLC